MKHAGILARRRLCWMILVMISFFLVSFATAHDKVVVAPLTDTVEAPHTPYGSLAAESPPDRAYTITAFGVIDNVTGLMWEQTASISANTWYNAWNYCQSKQTGFNGGLDDWRLPSVGELMSIVDYGAYWPAINSVAFPGTPQSPTYWTATASATQGDNGSDAAWVVTFTDGAVYPEAKSYQIFETQRCVRRLSARSIFKVNGNGTVTDLTTGRTWQQQDDNTRRQWDQANTYCQNLSLGGKTDWRLPNIKELRSIIDDRVSHPAIDEGAFVVTGLDYWSATPYASLSGYAWTVSFNFGFASRSESGSFGNRHYVRCVR